MTREDAGIEGPIIGSLEQALRDQDLIFKDTFPGVLGVRIVEAGVDGTTATLEVSPAVKHPGGFAHGGAIAGFGDTIAAWATMPHMQNDEWFTTIEFKINFVSAVAEGTLVGRGIVVHRGRRTVVVEVRITADERLVGVMLVTQAVIKGAAR